MTFDKGSRASFCLFRDLQAALDEQKPHRAAAVQVHDSGSQSHMPEWAQMLAYLLAQAPARQQQPGSDSSDSTQENGSTHPQNGERRQQDGPQKG